MQTKPTKQTNPKNPTKPNQTTKPPWTWMIFAKIPGEPASISTNKVGTNVDNTFSSPFLSHSLAGGCALLGTAHSVHGTMTQELL